MKFSAHWFGLVFPVVYLGCFALEQPVLYYYPLDGVWSLRPLGPEAGTVMHWYGLVAVAGLAASIAGWVLPERWIPQILRHRTVLVAVVAMLGSGILLRGFFL